MSQINKLLNPLFLALIIIPFLSCGQQTGTPPVHETQLNKNWKFKSAKDTEWNQATVPGTVHTDLISIGKIENPFYRLNEHDVQWIDKEDWEYETTFNVTEATLNEQHVELEFLGLDTYSHVYLNDSLILETDNMFRNYTTEVKKHLKAGENKLKVVLESPIKVGIEKYDALGYQIPVSDNDLAQIGKVDEGKKVSIFTRKAGYHFGWDWGPRLVTSGIWRPIKLRSWSSHKIEDLFVQQNKIDGTAELTAFIEVSSTEAAENATVEIAVNNSVVKTIEAKLDKGQTTLSIPFEIENPELWWPNGIGEQVLYNVETRVISDGYERSKSHKIGLRTIELIREPDSIGASFYFTVNGHPVFMKGANYIPQDVFLTRAKEPQYKHILTSAKEANMNMLRVWGGGIYENEEFYEMCDEMGLLVWQDFMFACAMFPGDEAFLENVRQEAIDNVKRLRNHTSIALWCGNNEILSAWENWGWKNNVIQEQSKAVADTIWKAYDDVFHKILPKVVKEYDNTRAYWPSSPGSDFGEKESHVKGDAHYWMVWWGKEPFDNYNKAIPRFMSEYGFQSFPEFNSVKKYTSPEDYDIYSDVMKSHQRSSIGNNTIEEYMLRHYKKPKDFESFLYVSHLLQSHGIKVGIEAHRRNRDRCMGSLYWQINDCWPVASWSSIDYYGKLKALHYSAKKAFKTFLISHETTKDNIDLFVISDSLTNVNAQLKVSLLDFEGKVLKNWEEGITVEANNTNKYLTIHKKALNKNKNVLLNAQLIMEGKVLAENIIYLSPFKELNFPSPKLTYSIKEHDNSFEVNIKTDRLAKDVFISANSDENFSDNYFDMLPNSEKTITIKKGNAENLESFKSNLKIMTLVDSFDK